MAPRKKAKAKVTPTLSKSIYGENGVLEYKGIATGFDYHQGATHLIDKYNLLYLGKFNRLYKYTEGVYREYDVNLLQRELLEVLSSVKKPNGRVLVKNTDIMEVISRVKSLKAVSASVFDQTDNIPYFALKNGMLNLETFKLEDFNPDKYLLTKSPITYDPSKKCEKWQAFLDSVFTKESKFQDTIQEMFGACLWPTYCFQKAFMLYGPPRAGKGIILRTLTNIIGKDDCAHISLQQAEDRFGPAALYGKKVNIWGDLPATPIKDPGRFKGLTGEDPMQVENKNIDGYPLYNTATMVFSTNQLPMLAPNVNDKGAFYSRWIMILFTHSFLGSENNAIEPGLQSEDELSGILNWSLTGLKRLLSNNWKFTEPIDSKAFYRDMSNPIVVFLNAECERTEPFSTDGFITKEALLNEAKTYMFENNLPPITSKRDFTTKMLDQVVIPVAEGRKGSQGNQYEVWTGIKFRPGRKTKETTLP